MQPCAEYAKFLGCTKMHLIPAEPIEFIKMVRTVYTNALIYS